LLNFLVTTDDRGMECTLISNDDNSMSWREWMWCGTGCDHGRTVTCRSDDDIRWEWQDRQMYYEFSGENVRMTDLEGTEVW